MSRFGDYHQNQKGTGKRNLGPKRYLCMLPSLNKRREGTHS